MNRFKNTLEFMAILTFGFGIGFLLTQDNQPAPPKPMVKYIIIESDTIVKFQGRLLFDGTIEHIASKKYDYVIHNNALQVLFRSKDTTFVEKNTYIESAKNVDIH